MNTPGRRCILFVYNADSGLFNALTDTAHKLMSPSTYRCNLCALTYSAFGMRREWRSFIEGLEADVEFLHADELRARHATVTDALPAVFERRPEGLRALLDAGRINACETLADLQGALTRALVRHAPSATGTSEAQRPQAGKSIR